MAYPDRRRLEEEEGVEHRIDPQSQGMLGSIHRRIPCWHMVPAEACHTGWLPDEGAAFEAKHPVDHRSDHPLHRQHLHQLAPYRRCPVEDHHRRRRQVSTDTDHQRRSSVAAASRAAIERHQGHQPRVVRLARLLVLVLVVVAVPLEADTAQSPVDHLEEDVLERRNREPAWDGRHRTLAVASGLGGGAAVAVAVAELTTRTNQTACGRRIDQQVLLHWKAQSHSPFQPRLADWRQGSATSSSYQRQVRIQMI